jgi:cobalamin-dependent methionine synthase I
MYMFIIASNITTRNAKIERTFRQLKAAAWRVDSKPAKILSELAQQCAGAGADYLEINTQQHFDRPEAMECAVNVVQLVTDCQLCLSTNSVETLEAGLRACKRPPLVNYISVDEVRLKNMLPLLAEHHAEVILLVSDPVAPSDAREMLQKAAILIGAANEAGISNGRILIDPGLIHITSDIGQRHLAEVKEFLQALPGTFDPPVKSICWIANASAGAPGRLRSVIETALLPMLAGLGLSCVFLDVLKRQNVRTVRLIKIFDNEVIYSHSALAL